MRYVEQRELALQIFKGKKYGELRKAIKNKECFDILLPIAEKAGAVEHWDKFIDGWKNRAGCWQSVTDEMRVKAFYELKDEETIIYAGCCWRGISDKMRREAFFKLKEKRWIEQADYYWHGITDEMKRKKQKEEVWARYSQRYYINQEL